MSRILIGALTLVPALGRFLVRGYLRAGGPIPSRASWVLMDLKRKLVPTNPIRRVSLKSDLLLDVNLGTTIGREIYYHGSYEPLLTSLLEELLQPGMVFIDAGANIGELTVRAARLVGPEGRVLAIEASPTTAESLRANVSLNELSNVAVHCSALADRDEPLVFHLGSELMSLSSSLSEPHDFDRHSVTVPGVQLDTLVEQAGLSRVDVLKMDIEGAELRALTSAKRLLSSAHPPIIIFEYNVDVAQRAGWNIQQIASYLAEFGYKIRPITNRGIGDVLLPISCGAELGDLPSKLDFLAAREV